MSMRKTLGGDRLGSGKKMTVDLKTYQRSTHDLSYIWRSTMASGTLVPFMTELGLPGDTFDIDLNIDVKTHPTIGPLFGSYKVQADIFMSPVRLYQAKLHNNALGIGLKMNEIYLPQVQMKAHHVLNTDSPDNTQINPSCLYSYLNIRGIGLKPNGEDDLIREFNALPLLTYWDIYKNYYANKQEENGAYIHSETEGIIDEVEYIARLRDSAIIPKQPISQPTDWLRTDILLVNWLGAIEPKADQIILNTNKGEYSIADLFEVATIVGDQTRYSELKFRIDLINSWRYIDAGELINKPPVVTTFPLTNIDEMRNEILAAVHNVTPFRIDSEMQAPYGPPLRGNGGFYSKLISQEGLGLKTYQSDLFNNWLRTEWIDGENGINAITAIDTSDGNFTIDTLNLSQKVYDMLNRIAVSGGSYDDWLDAVYTHERYRRCETPMYMGGLSKELVFQEVVSTAESVSTDYTTGQPLATLAGKGVMSGKHKGGKITVKVDEPCYIMGIISLTPRIDNSQGNKWDVNLKTMDDFHKPALDEIGFQDLITDQMAWWDTQLSETNEITFRSAGKQPAWINYMTNVNQVRGNFAIPENEMFMTLNRRYEQDPFTLQIKDLTTYIDPVKYNQVFAEVALDAQNFWVQIGLDITARRKMSAKVMPNL